MWSRIQDKDRGSRVKLPDKHALDDWQIIHCPNELSGLDFLQALRDLEALKMIRFRVSGNSGNNLFSQNDSAGHVRVEVQVLLRVQPQSKPETVKKRKRA